MIKVYKSFASNIAERRSDYVPRAFSLHRTESFNYTHIRTYDGGVGIRTYVLACLLTHVCSKTSQVA